jgi:nitrogen-specific signal transduction histidine kinase
MVDALLKALDELEVSELTGAQLDRLAEIVDRLQVHIDQEYSDRDDPAEED